MSSVQSTYTTKLSFAAYLSSAALTSFILWVYLFGCGYIWPTLPSPRGNIPIKTTTVVGFAAFNIFTMLSILQGMSLAAACCWLKTYLLSNKGLQSSRRQWYLLTFDAWVTWGPIAGPFGQRSLSSTLVCQAHWSYLLADLAALLCSVCAKIW